MKALLRRAPMCCCLTAAVVALAPGAVRAQQPSRPFGLEYGVYAGGLGVFNSTFTGSSPASTRLKVAPSLSGRLYVDLTTQLGRPVPGVTAALHARLSGLGGNKFFGFGNRSTALEPSGFYGIERYQLTVEPALTLSSAGGTLTLAGGPVFKYTSSESPGDGELERVGEAAGMLAATRPYGVGRFGQAGLQTTLRLSTLPSGTGTSGLRIEVGASAYPRLLDVTSAFGEAHAAVAGFLRLPLPAAPTVAVRVGGKRVVGTAPYHEAAYVGGTASLRGFRHQRFAGDASLYAGGELRFTVGQVALFGRTLEYGVLGLADAGRVFYDGRSPGGWHTSVGGGVWFRPAGGQSLSIALASGAEGARLHVGLGFPH